MKLLLLAASFLLAPLFAPSPAAPPSCGLEMLWNGEKWVHNCVSFGCSTTCSFQVIGNPGGDGDPKREFKCVCPGGGTSGPVGHQACVSTVIVTPVPLPIGGYTFVSAGCQNAGITCSTAKTCKPESAPVTVPGVPGTAWVPCLCKT
jgi:hypothetical protein